MSGISFISNSEIGYILKSVKRKYIVGDASFANIPDDNVEMGITSYSHFTSEEPHFHTRVSTYEYIIEGSTKYYDLTNKKEYQFSKGDVVVIRKGTIYAQKSLDGTKIIFLKYPSGNDKVPVETTTEVELWRSAWECSI